MSESHYLEDVSEFPVSFSHLHWFGICFYTRDPWYTDIIDLYFFFKIIKIEQNQKKNVSTLFDETFSKLGLPAEKYFTSEN